MEYRCFCCGGLCHWESDEEGEAVYPELEGTEEGSIISFYTCSSCGAEYEILQHGKKIDNG